MRPIPPKVPGYRSNVEAAKAAGVDLSRYTQQYIDLDLPGYPNFFEIRIPDEWLNPALIEADLQLQLPF